MSSVQKSQSETVRSGTTCGESSVTSKSTSASKRPSLPASIRRCPYCTRFGSAAHILRCGQQEMSCLDCGAVMQAVRLSAHAAYECAEREKLTPCVGCASLFCPLDLREHLTDGCPASSFPCGVCGKTFLTSAEYATHLYILPDPCRRAPVVEQSKESRSPVKETPLTDSPVQKKCDQSKKGGMLIKHNGKTLYADVQQLQCTRRDATQESCPRVGAAEAEEPSKCLGRVSNSSGASPQRHLSKFTQAVELPPKPPRETVQHVVYSPPSREARAQRRPPDCEHLPVGLRRPAAAAPGGFSRRSRQILRALQAAGAAQRPKYRRPVVAEAPRLATAELQQRRAERQATTTTTFADVQLEWRRGRRGEEKKKEGEQKEEGEEKERGLTAP